MGINVASCQYLGQCYVYEYTDGMGFVQTKTPSYSKSAECQAGKNHSGTYDIGIIKFKTPNIPLAISQYVKFIIPLVMHSNDLILNYALCTSDRNYSNYYRKYGTVNDNTQIATGIITKSDNIFQLTPDNISYFGFSLSIDTMNLKANTVYYLFMWAATSRQTSITFKTSGHECEMGYVYSTAYVDTGTKFDMYQCYIYDSEGWNLYTPYIDNGQSWDMYS